MTWSRVEDAPGVFTLRRGGSDVGTVSLLPADPVTGESLFPPVLAGVVVAALNDYDATVVVETEMRYRAKGWPSAGAYHAEVDTVKSITADLPGAVRQQLADAFERHGWTYPITPDQMSAWQDELLCIVCSNGEVAA